MRASGTGVSHVPANIRPSFVRADHVPRQASAAFRALHVPCMTMAPVGPDISHEPIATFGAPGAICAAHVPWSTVAPAVAVHEP